MPKSISFTRDNKIYTQNDSFEFVSYDDLTIELKTSFELKMRISFETNSENTEVIANTVYQDGSFNVNLVNFNDALGAFFTQIAEVPFNNTQYGFHVKTGKSSNLRTTNIKFYIITLV
jgi:hypothetical protein